MPGTPLLPSRCLPRTPGAARRNLLRLLPNPFAGCPGSSINDPVDGSRICKKGLLSPSRVVEPLHEDRVEVTKGLMEGERIVLSGNEVVGTVSRKSIADKLGSRQKTPISTSKIHVAGSIDANFTSVSP
jgi:hypothetical protein